MAISGAKTSTAPFLLKESDITEANAAGGKPAELGKANLLFWQRFKSDRESTARQTTVCSHRMILCQRNKKQKTKLKIIEILFDKVLQQLCMQVMERGDCLKKLNIGP